MTILKFIKGSIITMVFICSGGNALAQFTQPDRLDVVRRAVDPRYTKYNQPLDLRQPLNQPYTYTGNNPVNKVDPLGLMNNCPTGMAPDTNNICKPTPFEDPNAKVCLTAECSAGIPPGKSENRTLKEIENSQCKLICGTLWPGPILPLSKTEILPWAGGQVSSYLGCKWICDDPKSCGK